MKIRKRIWIPALLFAGFLFVLLDSILIYAEYSQYQEKCRIAAAFLGENHVSISALKYGTFPSWEETKNFLSQYGYENISSSFFGTEFFRHSIWILAVSIVCFLLLFAAGFYLLYQQNWNFESMLCEISKMLETFREGNFQTDLVWKHLEDDTSRIKDIYMQMETLGGYFNQLKDRAQKEKENTKVLVTDISHQLKTPIAALKACLDILKQEDFTREERKEFLQRCEDQMAGLEQMAAALIQISRMETGMIRLQMEEKRIFDTVLNAVNRIIPKTEEKDIVIDMEIPQPLQTLILSHDSKWMEEALINLLENAVKYSPSGSQIKITMEQWMNFVKIDIEDEGIGIPKEEQHKVFQRFYRGGAKEVRRQPGTGIGLFLTREIISRHCGTIKVTSNDRKKQKGSVFQVQLPISITF